MRHHTISLLEVLCIITILILLAFFLDLLAGPLISTRRQANLSQCGNQLSCFGKAMFQYESPAYFDQSPFPDDTPLARRDSNVMALMPIIALFRANLMDNTQIIFCPVDENVEPNDRLLTAPAPVLPGVRPQNLTSYLYTLYYDKADNGNRVIAGDVSGSILPNKGFTPNHEKKTFRDDRYGGLALFKDGHLKPSSLNYRVEGAQQKDGATEPQNLWDSGGVRYDPAADRATGTQIGAYE